jgi:putative membrane protein
MFPNRVPRRLREFPVALFLVFTTLWVYLAIDPLYREAWVFENIVIALFTPIVVWSYFAFRLSNTSYILIFIFASLHILAAHYTYADTPWGHFLSELWGLERNHFDRVVHFLYGLLMVPVFADLLKKYLPKEKWAVGVFLFAVSFSIGALYEVGEFVVGVVGDPGAGLAFLGFQGDIWDTQKDMVFQGIGTIFSILSLYFFVKKSPMEKKYKHSLSPQ